MAGLGGNNKLNSNGRWSVVGGQAAPSLHASGETANVLCQFARDFVGDDEIVKSLTNLVKPPVHLIKSLVHLSDYQIEPFPFFPRILPILPGVLPELATLAVSSATLLVRF
jgi:hypothetical protein